MSRNEARGSMWSRSAVVLCLLLATVVLVGGCKDSSLVGDPASFVLEGFVTDELSGMPVTSAQVLFNGKGVDETSSEGGYGVVISGFGASEPEHGALVVKAASYEDQEFQIPEDAQREPPDGKRYVLNVRLKRVP